MDPKVLALRNSGIATFNGFVDEPLEGFLRKCSNDIDDPLSWKLVDVFLFREVLVAYRVTFRKIEDVLHSQPLVDRNEGVDDFVRLNDYNRCVRWQDLHTLTGSRH